MNRKTSAFLFLGVCLTLAILLLTKTITPIISGSVFAVGLVAYGILSSRYKK